MNEVTIYTTKSPEKFFSDLLSGKLDYAIFRHNLIEFETMKFMVLSEEIIFWDHRAEKRYLGEHFEGLREYEEQKNESFDQFGGGKVYIEKSNDTCKVQFKGKSIKYDEPEEHPFLELFTEFKKASSSYPKISISHDEEYLQLWREATERKIKEEKDSRKEKRNKIILMATGIIVVATAIAAYFYF